MVNERWVDSIVEAFNSLDNFEGNLTKDIYLKVYRIRQSRGLSLCSTYDSFKATVRQTIESFSQDSDNFTRVNHPNIFSLNGNKGSGNWRLNEEYQDIKTFTGKPLETLRAEDFIHIQSIDFDNDEDMLAMAEDGKQLLTIEEAKLRKEHYKYEGCLKSSQIKKIKANKGYVCEACGMSFEKRYPGIGDGFIECHHKKTYSSMKEGETRNLNVDDFMVLCSNCHKMIHRLDDPADLKKLKTIISQEN